MKLDQIRGLTDQELKDQVQQAGEQLFRIRFQKSMGNLEGLKALKTHKLDIARVMTVQRERQLELDGVAVAGKRSDPSTANERTSRKKAQKA